MAGPTIRFEPFTRNRFLYLTVCIILTLILRPLLEGHSAASIRFLLTVMFLSAVYAISNRGKYILISLALMAPVIGLGWINYFMENRTLAVIHLGLDLVALVVILLIVFAGVLRDREVSSDTIAGAIATYLLIGYVFAMAFALALYLEPNSLALPERYAISSGQPMEASAIFSGLLYYSFVTLTTLGYGEITPETSATMTLAYAEAVIGQLFIAILIARLVGLHIVKATAE